MPSGEVRTSRPLTARAPARSADHLSGLTFHQYAVPAVVVTNRLRPPSRPDIPVDCLLSMLAIESSSITVTSPLPAATFLAAWLLAIAAPISDPPPTPIKAPRAPGPVCGGRSKVGIATRTPPTRADQPITDEWTYTNLSE